MDAPSVERATGTAESQIVPMFALATMVKRCFQLMPALSPGKAWKARVTAVSIG